MHYHRLNEGLFPNVFYIGPAIPGMVLDPTHVALWRLADTRTLWVPDDRIDALRSYLIHRQRSVHNRSTQNYIKPSGREHSLFRWLSLMLHNALQRLDISSLSKIRLKPDLIFVVEVYRKLEGLEKFSCPKAFYVQDPHMGIRRYFDLAHVQDYDFVFVRQKDYVSALKEGGCQHVFWMPESFDPDIILGPFGVRDIPVTFIGNRYPGTERERMLNMLERKFGAINPLAYVRSMASILRRSKIVFNVSRAGDLNNRVFDAMGAGAMLVTERIQNGLLDLFEDGNHLVSYSDVKQLEELVSYYLANSEEREKIAKSGQYEVMRKHTSLDRAYFMLSTCLDEDKLSVVRQRFQVLKEEFLGNSPSM